jgi:hypothetical protein
MTEMTSEVVDENVDVPAETEETDAPATPADKPEKKASKRPPVPSGYDTPINFAHALTARLQSEGQLKEGEVFKPQVVYSYVKNRSKNDPFPVYFVFADGSQTEEPTPNDGSRPLLKVEEDGTFAEAMAWWDRKDERKAQRAQNAKDKAAKKAAGAQKKADAPVEAEGVEPAPSEFAEVEEAE